MEGFWPGDNCRIIAEIIHSSYQIKNASRAANLCSKWRASGDVLLAANLIEQPLHCSVEPLLPPFNGVFIDTGKVEPQGTGFEPIHVE
jgi:hypothetical protein